VKRDAEIESLDLGVSIRDAKGVEGRGMGKGVPIPNRLEGVGSIVNLPQRDPGCTGSLAESGFLVHFELERTHVVRDKN